MKSPLQAYDFEAFKGTFWSTFSVEFPIFSVENNELVCNKRIRTTFSLIKSFLHRRWKGVGIIKVSTFISLLNKLLAHFGWLRKSYKHKICLDNKISTGHFWSTTLCNLNHLHKYKLLIVEPLPNHLHKYHLLNKFNYGKIDVFQYFRYWPLKKWSRLIIPSLALKIFFSFIFFIEVEILHVCFSGLKCKWWGGGSNKM